MSFSTLSDDIILDIFDFSWAWYRIHSLRNIALCSKRLNDLATPLLYKEFDLHSWDDEVLLLRTLLRNPKLGYVRIYEYQLLCMTFIFPHLRSF